jgi:hypothetical protein
VDVGELRDEHVRAILAGARECARFR